MSSRTDLIVAPCRARHRLPTILGYTDWSLLRDSPVPLLLVKSGGRYRRPRVLAAIDPQRRYSKPGELDANILSQAVTFARAFRTAPHAVYGFANDALALADEAAAPAAAGTVDSPTRNAARGAFVDALRAFSIPPARRHFREANPVQAIAETARRTHAAIVVMGALSRRGVKGFFIGNTAERLLDELPCDVLIIKPAKFVAATPRRRRGAGFLMTPTFP